VKRAGSFLRDALAVLTLRSRRDERGAIAIIAALALPAMLAGSALAFDIGDAKCSISGHSS